MGINQNDASSGALQTIGNPGAENAGSYNRHIVSFLGFHQSAFRAGPRT
jgi:hypothetical protein